MTFSDTMKALNEIRHSSNMSSEFQVAYQQVAIEKMERRLCRHTNASDQGQTRCASCGSSVIKTGVVKFPRTGCEQLMTQLLGFGGEKHDDASMPWSISSSV